MRSRMAEQLVIGGFGGQGVLFIGQLLGYAASAESRKVTYLAAYGPEMRGGTANCQIIVSDGAIMSPMFKEPTSVIAMNVPSLDKYEATIKPGGILVVNSSMVNELPKRSDIRIFSVAANHIAEESGGLRMANLAVLGAYVAASRLVHPQSIVRSLPELLTDQKSALITANIRAFEAGFNSVMT